MVFFNYALRKLNAKIVYYGPGLCGKTTNLQWVHDNFEGGDKGKMVSLATEGDRTIFFDLLPLDIGKIRGMDVTLQLYTVPGQVHYNSTRQLVLRGADGVVFVADSQQAMQSSNIESLKNLDENLGLQGVNLEEFPHVIQFNKRDLGGLMGIEEMDAALNRFDAPFFEAVAVEGIGVQETLEGIVRLVMRSLKGRYESRGLGSDPSRLKPASEAGPWPFPEVDSTGSQPGIRPLSVSDIPAIPTVDDGGAGGLADDLGAVGFDIEKEPEIISVEDSPDMNQDTTGEGQPFDSKPPIEDFSNVHDVEPPAPEFDSPAFDVGPAVEQDVEILEELEPVPFEEVDTQTGLLVPSMGAFGLGDLGGEPANLMPSGPGKPVESDDGGVSVAQYDTADVEELRHSIPDDHEAPSEETSGEIDGSVGPDVEESASPESLDQAEYDPFGDTNDGASPDSTPQYDVDSLVASVLDRQGATDAADDGGTDPAREQSEGADAKDPFAENVYPDEISSEELNAEEVPFEPEAKPAEEPDLEPFSAGEFSGETEPTVTPEPEEDLPVFQKEPDEPVFPVGPEMEPDENTTSISAGDEAVQAGQARPNMAPVVFDDSDPFADAAWDQPAVVSPADPAVAVPVEAVLEAPVESGVLAPADGDSLPVSVSAADNSLALKLTGTGAIVESGQVRELDIEVPVPGDWVGNRRVTLQLRLTLSPVAEDENDGTTDPA